ncbi:hypothetical protein GCM10008955_24450 [Deinococcus malanensis]|uniref:Uncharacterized protein n=1 Tax=Deinococcus malanensis TaxID=1706855 RepID=A0ABQ2EXH7_9DEIO|nr:hypothetical protein GCM10008955_24450 [Deinococcus malanensis]
MTASASPVVDSVTAGSAFVGESAVSPGAIDSSKAAVSDATRVNARTTGRDEGAISMKSRRSPVTRA